MFAKVNLAASSAVEIMTTASIVLTPTTNSNGHKVSISTKNIKGKIQW